MNLPNKLTLLRIILLFPLIILVILYSILIKQGYIEYGLAGRILLALMLLIFVGAMITDYFDGKIARKNNQITSFGKLWDPLADKLITSTLFISLCAFGFIPIWITVIFIARDIVVDGFRIVMTQNNVGVEASKWGKLKTVFQTVAIALVLTIGIIFDFSNKVNAWYLQTNNAQLFYWISIYLINIPTMLALFFSLFSGFDYFKKVKPFIQSA